ncbi:antibiotic biosynthesis monooxygenase [Ligilactobacillus apodemi]|uniref:antibiotic biosynthesis monooxygenase n=1 Tax=Ligilactobacillus apodemi TaxID=307126 RepID=UPI00214BFA14|nr:antibiotic biosynthesis monooxygenase [Ligilactobacillus apodemi]MCR1901792.1 antibiotic biosynthesis monooxygenase [Ligilactobacillus apodemi]
MALNEINFALGPEKMLATISERYADRDFLLYKAIAKQNEYLLVDISDQSSVFETGLNYRVLKEIGTDDWDGLLELRYVTLDTDQQKVFNAVVDSWVNPAVRPTGLKTSKLLISLKKDFQFLLMNVWEDEADYLAWNDSPENKVAQFGHDGNQAPVDKLYNRAN